MCLEWGMELNGNRAEGEFLGPFREHMAEPFPALTHAQETPAPGASSSSGTKDSGIRYLEGLQAHKARLALLVLDDEKRTAIFVECQSPHGRHGPARRDPSQQPAETN